jgi:hypothetical protein
MQPAISCTEHHELVSLAKGDPLICHQDGSYCRSQQFTVDTLSRPQAMALLIMAKGWQIINPQDPSSGDT